MGTKIVIVNAVFFLRWRVLLFVRNTVVLSFKCLKIAIFDVTVVEFHIEYF